MIKKFDEKFNLKDKIKFLLHSSAQIFGFYIPTLSYKLCQITQVYV